MSEKPCWQLPLPSQQPLGQLLALQTQVEFTQVCPEGQTCPQAPQLLRSVCKFVSQPLARFPSQLPKPALQEIWQVLLTQLAVPLVELQTFAHDPQWFGSVTVFVSQPLDAMPSQSAKP